MSRRKVIVLQAVVLLTAVWLAVWGIRAAAGSQRASTERLQATIEKADLVDWSQEDRPPDPRQAERRDREIRKVASIINRLDFREREKSREQRLGEAFYLRLNPAERQLFIDLTISESMNRFMEALDAMPIAERRKFVEKGLDEIAAGRTAEDMTHARELGENLLARITEEGTRAYFETTSSDTKLDLAPLMEAMNEVMQGLRGDEFGPPKR